MMKECVVVLGMHRSGTSVLSGLVSAQGFYVGSDVMPAHENNPKGYFENMKVCHLNDMILQEHNASWDDHSFTIEEVNPQELYDYEMKIGDLISQEYGSANRIFIKDPRMCLLFPLWSKVLSGLGYKIKVILAYRSPMEVASSLMLRDKMPLEKSLMIWSHYFFQAEKSIRGFPRLSVRYDTDIRDLDAYLLELSGFLEVELTDEMISNSHDLYSPSLKHHELKLGNLFAGAPAYLKQFVAILKNAEWGDTEEIDSIANEFYNAKKYYSYNEAELKGAVQTRDEKISGLILRIEKEQSKTQRKLDKQKAQIDKQKAQIDKQKAQIDKTAELHAGLNIELARVKDDYEEQLKGKVLQITSGEERIQSLQSEVFVGEQIFHAAFVDGEFNKKILRIVKGWNYFKLKSILSQFYKRSDENTLKDKALIVESGLFSPFYYLTKNSDIWEARVDPLSHFVSKGWQEGRSPSQHFDCAAYLENNSDVKELGDNPLVHFIKYGQKEGRSPETRDRVGLSEGILSMPLKGDDLSVFQKLGLVVFKTLSQKFLSIKLINKLERSPFAFFRDSKSMYVRLYGLFFMLTRDRYVPTSIVNEPEYSYYNPFITRSAKQEIAGFKYSPLMSVVLPVSSAGKELLEKSIRSLKAQWYKNWEIIIVGTASESDLANMYKSKSDHRVKVQLLDGGSDISIRLNKSLEMCSGEYIVLMEHADELTPDALFEVVKVINRGDYDFIYSDEDEFDEKNNYYNPHYKADYSPDMLLSQNYLSHLSVIKKSLVEQVKGWSLNIEGAQNYDLYLKVLEHTNKISHISKVLYHHRVGAKSLLGNSRESGLKVINAALNRRGLEAQVENGKDSGTYRVKYDVRGAPLVSIIIPFKDMPDLLDMCIVAILDKSTYQNYEIIGISNNSEEPETFSMMRSLEAKDSRINFYEYNQPFNYSSINNYAIDNHAKGEHVLLLNNDIEIITPEWIEELLMFSQRPDVGAVGAKLYYPNDTIQHAGVIIGIGQTAGHSHKRLPRSSSGYFGRLNIVQNLSAVTAACLMVKKSVYDEVGGLNDKNLKVAFNDVDICLRIREIGYLNVYTPHCEAYHYESISRGYEDNPEKIARFNLESKYLQERHQLILEKGDPYYNKNLILSSEDFQLKPVDFSANHQNEITNDFAHKIIINKVLRSKKHKYVCVFSHYDKDGVIDNYVIHYVKALSEFSDVIFVSTAQTMKSDELNKIRSFCIQVIVKENFGYDFGAWKTGLELTEVLVSDYECLILCNDSVYGPFYDLKETVDTAMSQYDVFSITDSYEIAHHLQSYFMVYSKSAISHKVFRDFWDYFIVYENKNILIRENEVKFSNDLMDSSLLFSTLCKAESVDKLNQLHSEWDKLILDKKCPFVKIELLRDNPAYRDLSRWKTVIQSTGYDTELIEHHLGRMT